MKKKPEDHPLELSVSTYWSRNGVSTLRTALSWDHPENQYNWFCREYPELEPKYYGIEKPRDPRNRCPHCKHVIGDVEYEHD